MWPTFAPLAVAILAAHADAAPLAQLASDLDGDGSADSVVLEASGELLIQTKRGTSKLPLRAGIKHATLTSAIARGTPVVLVQTDTEAIVVQAAGAQWKQLVRTPIGGIGLDADYGKAVTVTRDGVFRYQTRAGYRRCDDQPALLFGERFEAGKFQRLARLPIGIPDGVPVIAARVDPDSAHEPLAYKAHLASHQRGAPDAGALAIPAELVDGKLDTAWSEELVASTGEGQFFTYVPRYKGAKATQVRVVPGTPKGGNRPKRLGVVSKAGAWRIDLPDAQAYPAGSAFIADLPSPIAGCVTIVLESTYGPDKGTTSIAELAVFGDGERSGGGEATLARVIAQGADGAQAAAQALARQGASGVAAIEAELARTTDSVARGRLVRAAMTIRDPAAGPLLARAAKQGIVQGQELVDLIGALSGLGQAQALHDLAARSGLAIEARVAATRALQPATREDRDLLIGLAGDGPRALRQAVIEQLSTVEVAVLAPAARARTKPSSAGDLWRAITRRAHATPTERPEALVAMSAALPSADDYERRYRLVDGIAAVGDAAALRSLAAQLAKLPDDAETAAYKQIAARALAVNPRLDAVELLIALTRDRDPGVRLAALSAIAGASGAPGGPWHRNAGPDGIDRVIMTMLANDTWPEVRRNAAQVLGGRCVRTGPARALADAVARDRDLNVRGDALAGLVECKAAGTAELLAKLWDDGKAPIELRRRAVDLTVTLADNKLAHKLVGKFAQWRGAAIESEAALALAQNAAFAIGSLAAPGAAAALASALDDAAFPEIVAAAATGLGLLGPACPVSARKKLEALTASDEQQVQIAARRAAATCGKR